MEISKAKRTFHWKDKEYPDPNPEFSLRQVADHYAGLYPEWVTAKIVEKEVANGVINYEVKSDFKEKG
jgi:PRTRC genetic system protein C